MEETTLARLTLARDATDAFETLLLERTEALEARLSERADEMTDNMEARDALDALTDDVLATRALDKEDLCAALTLDLLTPALLLDCRAELSDAE